jgi:CubicO group peptidase (beta-lactamase class C family)
MQRNLTSLLVLFVCTFVSLTNAFAQTQTPKTSGSEEVSRMEKLVQSYVSTKRFMGSVLVARGNQVLLSKGYGFANLEWNMANTPSTKFLLASITKQFTAACILLLEEHGKLNVNAPIKKYMPDAPTGWDKVTIFNLLTHTSGIPDLTGFPDWGPKRPFPAPPASLVARFRDKPLNFQPGEKYGYSNSGYVLLGYLIEQISGKNYGKFLSENIFTPLRMRDSGYSSNSNPIPRLASGYSPGKNGLVSADVVSPSVLFSSGGIYSTTEDLLRWEESLFEGKLLSAASLQKMTTPFKSDYALGLGVMTINGHKTIGHAGNVEGFSTALNYYPDDKLIIVVLGNQNGKASQEIEDNLAAIVHGQQLAPPLGTK